MNDEFNTERARPRRRVNVDKGDIRFDLGVEVPAAGLIEIRVAPRADMIATVRAVASDVASRADFNLDTVADVRMAVDEACNQVASHADPHHQMRVVFGMHADGCLRVTITARARPGGGGLDTGGFGWRVLSTLTDELDTETCAGPDGDEVIVRLSKREPGT